MNVALVGYGKMGKMLAERAGEYGMSITSIIDPMEKDATHKSITQDSVMTADVCIDFSRPKSVRDNINQLIKLRKNIVVGTTGWSEHLNEIKEEVESSGIGFIYADNFSIGMNLFYRIVEYSARLFNSFDAYDVSGFEMHHNQKADSPSGTAKQIVELVLKNMEKKKIPLYDRSSGKINSEELHFASIRSGYFPGTHKVIFDSLPDSIELAHIARSREGFCDGALQAARWILNKKGFFSINDFINNIISEER